MNAQTMTNTFAFLDSVSASLPLGRVISEEADLTTYETGWRYGRGKALAAIRPSSTDELAFVMAKAHEHSVRLQPVGANTGLVGATNPDASGEQVVLSFERLSKELEINVNNRTVIVGAGVTLSQLNEALDEHGLFFPVDLGADPQIGGMIATNTGGTRLVRYGAMRDHILGLEVVLADGTVWSDMSELRKDNRGLDWKQLFVGTSGTFGVVSRAVLNVEKKNAQESTAWAACTNTEAALNLLGHLEGTLGECLTAFEVLSQDALEETLKHGHNIQNPFNDGSPRFAVLIELATTMKPEIFDLEGAMLTVLENFMESHPEDLEDVAILPPHDAWNIRHQVSESIRHEHSLLALDVSVPRDRIGALSERIRSLVDAEPEEMRLFDFGHWGDGGSHLNIGWKKDSLADEANTKDRLQTAIYDICVTEFGGSFSAEHGVGPHNQKFYDRYVSAEKSGVSKLLKDHFDPDGRLGTVRF